MALTKSQVGGRGTDTLEQCVMELNREMGTQENSDGEAEKQSMGLVESLVPNGSDTRYLGLVLKTAPIKRKYPNVRAGFSSGAGIKCRSML